MALTCADYGEGGINQRSNPRLQAAKVDEPPMDGKGQRCENEVKMSHEGRGEVEVEESPRIGWHHKREGWRHREPDDMVACKTGFSCPTSVVVDFLPVEIAWIGPCNPVR